MYVVGKHNLLVIDSTLLVVFRDIVNHVGLGITVELVRAALNKMKYTYNILQTYMKYTTMGIL